ncbi:MAG: hypothetical protein GY798_31480 [Hyphomicrobiales bacterium]|nr:hypothetical protein [Hyphomicrobiales bacterium]
MTDSIGDPTESNAAWPTLAARFGIDPESLTSHTVDGLPVGPIYPASDHPPLSGGSPDSSWTVYQRLDCSDRTITDATIRAAVDGGVTSIALVLANDDWPALVRILSLPIVEQRIVNIRLEASAIRGQDGNLAAVLSRATPPSRSLDFVCDPVGGGAVRGILDVVEADLDAIFDLAGAMDQAEIPGQTMIVDGRPWHNGGASKAQELAAVLGSAITYLRHAESKGVDPDSAADRLGVMLAADSDQFLTTAKFRAARLLFGRVIELASLGRQSFRLHAETSWRMMCRRDPYLNLLRTTTAALAAVTGGADTLTVWPFDLGDDPFANRMARNVQTIARDEAALGRVTDPGAGSGAIEALTDELAAAAWAEFQTLEAEGGLLASLQDGGIQGRIAMTAATRRDKIARREIEIVGVTAHIDRDRPLPTLRPVSAGRETPADADAGRLRPARLAVPFEQLCDRALAIAAAGTPAAVFMAKIGQSGPAANAVATAVEALATGGITASDAVDMTDDSLFAADINGAVACLAAPPDTAQENLETATVKLRAAGARFVLLSKDDGFETPPPEADDLLWADADLPSVLSGLLDVIAIIAKNRQNQAT